ncbi:hypothetical protein BCM0075_2710 [Bacillus cereus]|nr:hypothetical protein BCM0075_2710 [Bacillus cereus]
MFIDLKGKCKNPHFFFEDEETDLYCTYQFSLKYFAGDIKYKRLIKAANHEDLPGLYPRLGRKKRNFLSRCISHKCNKRYYHVYA